MSSSLAHLTRRPIALAVAAALSELLNAIEVVDVFGEYYSEEDAAEQINAPTLDLERGTIGVFDGEVMVGYSSAAHKRQAEGIHRVVPSGGVHPNYRRLGLGTELLTSGIACAKALHALHHPRLQLSVDVQNNVRNIAALSCYRAAGMTQSRSSSHMRHPLGATVPDTTVPEGYAIEAHTPDNDSDFFVASDDAFLESRGGIQQLPEQWHGLLSWQAFRPSHSFLLRATSGDTGIGAAAGMLLAFSWDADTEATGVRDLHFMRVGTRPGFRRRGVASVLLGHGLAAARDAGFDRVSLDVDTHSTGAASLFERLGFATARTEVVYTLTP